MVAVWLSVNVLASINVVAIHQTRLVQRQATNHLMTGKPSQCVTSHPDRLNLLRSMEQQNVMCFSFLVE